MSSGAGSHIEKVERLYKDVYYGNGKPGLTTRMQMAEERQDNMDERCDKSDKKIGQIQMMFWAIVVLLLSILGTTLADVVKGHNAPPQENHSFNY